jgi:hypothetical protein
LRSTVGDGGDDFYDAAHLLRQVGRHNVDVISEILPRACDARYLGLTAKVAVGANLARHAGDFGRKGVKLVHHGVDGVFELEDFAFDIDSNFA